MILVTIIRIRSRSIIVNVIRTEYGSHQLQQELIDRTERRENYDDITEEILRLRELQAQTAMDDNAKTEHKKRIRELLKFIERQKSKVLVFDGSLVKKLLEKVTVYDDYLEFRFKSGVTVSVEK